MRYQVDDFGEYVEISGGTLEAFIATVNSTEIPYYAFGVTLVENELHVDNLWGFGMDFVNEYNKQKVGRYFGVLETLTWAKEHRYSNVVLYCENNDVQRTTESLFDFDKPLGKYYLEKFSFKSIDFKNNIHYKKALSTADLDAHEATLEDALVAAIEVSVRLDDLVLGVIKDQISDGLI